MTEKEEVLSKIEFLDDTKLSEVVNLTYLSRRFFGKSLSWLSQRLNHNEVNGKRVDFSREELFRMSNALQTVALELQDLSDELYQRAGRQ